MEELYRYDLASFFITMEQLGIPVNIKRYMEIGVQDGNSTVEVVRKYPGLELMVLCDNWGDAHGGTGRGSHEYVEARLRDAALSNMDLNQRLVQAPGVLFLDGDSRIRVPTYFANNPEMYFDLIYVDDDHSAATLTRHLGVVLGKADFIACHDLCMEGLAAAVYFEYLKRGQEYILIYDFQTQSRMGIFVKRERL